jgi:hypothetical protein
MRERSAMRAGSTRFGDLRRCSIRDDATLSDSAKMSLRAGARVHSRVRVTMPSTWRSGWRNVRSSSDKLP